MQKEGWEVNKMFRNRVFMQVKAYPICTIILHTRRRLATCRVLRIQEEMILMSRFGLN